MSGFAVALVLGFVVGLRAFVGPAAVAWAAWLVTINLAGTWGAFMGSMWAVGILTILAVVEFVLDQLPGTPSRKVPKQFIPRLFSGAFCGALVCTTSQSIMGGVVAGLIGSALGTFSGYEFRRQVVAAIGGQDWPVALIEDVLALALAFSALMVFA